MDIKIRVCTESQPGRRKFSHRSCRDSNPWPFNHESSALTTELSPPLHVMCVAFPSKTPDGTKAFKSLQSSVSTQLKEKESELLNQHITITITTITNVQTMIVIHIIYIYFVKFWQDETDTVVWCYLYRMMLRKHPIIFHSEVQNISAYSEFTNMTLHWTPTITVICGTFYINNNTVFVVVCFCFLALQIYIITNAVRDHGLM